MRVMLLILLLFTACKHEMTAKELNDLVVCCGK